MEPTTGNGGLDTRLTLIAATLVGAESSGLLAGAIYVGVETLSQTPDSMGAAIGLIVMALLFAAGLGVCVAGIVLHRSWVRGPVFTWQLVQGGVAMRLTAQWSAWAGLPLLAAAIVVGVLIAGPWVVPPRERTL